jgi:hypothetical protein
VLEQMLEQQQAAAMAAMLHIQVLAQLTQLHLVWRLQPLPQQQQNYAAGAMDAASGCSSVSM